MLRHDVMFRHDVTLRRDIMTLRLFPILLYMKMQLDQQRDHPGDQLPVQLYILVVLR